jgi:hypothetical protein
MEREIRENTVLPLYYGQLYTTSQQCVSGIAAGCPRGPHAAPCAAGRECLGGLQHNGREGLNSSNEGACM